MAIRPYSLRIERLRNLVNALTSDPAVNSKSLIANVERATVDESLLLDGLFTIVDAYRFRSEIFRGAHVRIEDGGWFYNDWRRLGSAISRASSHDSDVQQYEVAGPCCHAFLFGRRGGKTWFQMENNAYKGSKLAHGIDYVKYKLSDENQGPYGSSIHTDKHELMISAMADDD